MKDKNDRLKTIKKLIKAERIQSQDSLLLHLQKEGFDVTQATLSRDLKLLKVGKISDGSGGYIYTVNSSEDGLDSEKIYVQDFLRGYISIDFSGNMLVIKTLPGHANTVCNAIDNLGLDDILGTVAGENCMFGVLKEGVKGADFMEVLREKIPGLEE